MPAKPKPKPKSRVHVVRGVISDQQRAELEARFPNRPKSQRKPKAKRRAWVVGYLDPEDRARIEREYNCIIRDGPPPPARKRK